MNTLCCVLRAFRTRLGPGASPERRWVMWTASRSPRERSGPLPKNRFSRRPASSRPTIDAPDSSALPSAARRALSFPVGGSFLVARLNADGSLDSSFGQSGVVQTDWPVLGPATPDVVVGVVLQGDKIVVAGAHSESLAGSSSSFLDLARYNPDGSLDS